MRVLSVQQLDRQPTTIQRAELARYVTAIANSGNLYQLSILDKITDSEGNVLEENEPKLTNKIELKQSTWDNGTYRYV